MSEINQARAMLDAMIQVREKVKKKSLELEQDEAKNRELEAKLSIAVEALELIGEDYANGVAIYAGEALEKIRGD